MLKVPQIQFFDRLPAVQTVQKTVGIPQVQALFAGSVLETVKVPQLQYSAKVVDVPVEAGVVWPSSSWTRLSTCPLLCI